MDLQIPTAIYEGLKWLLNLTASDVKHVKEETRELISHLRTSLTSLWELNRAIVAVADERFNDQFDQVYEYFKKFYYGDENFDKIRTHCTDLKRDISRIRYKLSIFLRTDMGKWEEAEKGLQFGILMDENFFSNFKGELDILNDKLSKVHNLIVSNEPVQALELFRQLRADCSKDLDQLNGYIDALSDTYIHFNQIVG